MMTSNYPKQNLAYSYQDQGVDPMAHRDPDELTNMTIKVVFAVIIAMLMMGLVLFCIMALA